MNLGLIVEEGNRLPREQLAELIGHLSARPHDGIARDIEAAWQRETRQRIAEIESGKEPGIPSEVVSARIRKIVGR